MSFWEEHDFENKIREILSRVRYRTNPDHHLGNPFLSPYQIAFEFNNLYPDIVQLLGYPIGGRGTNDRVSLSQYIAGQLSRRIASGEITDIEGGFFSNSYLKDIVFEYNTQNVYSSLTGSPYDLSIFRLR